jgi:predicted dehydrogenase
MARRFEVYGGGGSAILEPFEPAGPIRLCLLAPAAGVAAGEQRVTVPVQSRQALYEAELAAFHDAVRGRRPPDRPLAHELLVQETLLRATGGMSG